jgi:hypothetical protein
MIGSPAEVFRNGSALLRRSPDLLAACKRMIDQTVLCDREHLILCAEDSARKWRSLLRGAGFRILSQESFTDFTGRGWRGRLPVNRFTMTIAQRDGARSSSPPDRSLIASARGSRSWR